MQELYLRTRDDGYLHETEQQREHEGKDEGELDDGRPPFHHARFATEMTFSITVLKNEGNMSVLDAHVINASATTAAATSTNAYSAVA
jgi:hypothetical protein